MSPGDVHLARRWVAGVCAVAMVASMGWLGMRFFSQSNLPLHGAGVVIGPEGTSVVVHGPDEVLAGSRVHADAAEAANLRATQLNWLLNGHVPSVPELGSSTMISDALLDLFMLSRDHGVSVAGWSDAWRYGWPRDIAFVASAFARTGHRVEAEEQLTYLGSVLEDSGVFHARYTPDTRIAPDDRGVELDGTGWALWAMREVFAELETEAERRSFVARHQPLLDATATAAMGLVRQGADVAPVSKDYWEVAERRPTLATSAVLLAGLRGAVEVYGGIGAEARAATIAGVADRLERTIIDQFGPDFPRRLGGSAASVDLGATFLLTPFAGVVNTDLDAAWRESPARMSRPAGGLAPGGSWRRDGISWTPTVATYAMAAACRDREDALDWLRWLDAHRTPLGSLPEKVLADGSPASVAPLAWTAAAVVIAADQLDNGC